MINSSWSGTDTFGTVDTTIALDGLAFQNPRTTFVAAAGNAARPRQQSQYAAGDEHGGCPASGYNSISVGALQNDGSNHYNSVASYSSRGPQDFGYVDCLDGRSRLWLPGLPGGGGYRGPRRQFHARVLWWHDGRQQSDAHRFAGRHALAGPNFVLRGLAGTSFSTPIVSGGAALLDSASYSTPALAVNPNSRDARVIKAVMMNSADKIAGWNNGETPNPNGFGGVVTSQSLDYVSGAGALNLNKAYGQYVTAGTRDVPGTLSGLQGSVAADRLGLRASRERYRQRLSHFSRPKCRTGNDGDARLVSRPRRSMFPRLNLDDVAQSDLDLYVRDTITGNIISESISSVNDVEHLYFTLPRTSLYQLEVNFFGTVFDFSGTHNSEQYGLAWSVAAAVPEPTSCVLFALGIVAFVTGRRR